MTTTDAHTPDSDLVAALTGDQDAIARTLVWHGDRLSRRIAIRLKLNPSADIAPEDVLQEVFVLAWRKFATFDPARGASLSTWLNRIADNCLVSMLRKRGSQKRGGRFRHVRCHAGQDSSAQFANIVTDDRQPSPSGEFRQQELVRTVRKGLAELPSDQRQAVSLRYFDRRSVASTARAMEKTGGAVRGLLHRAKQTMREMLGTSSRWFAP